MRFDLGRMATVLRRFGSPQHAFPAVHIAGTNGKGSVVALISQTLIDAGHRVGVYTSPHLVRMTERFQINGREISQKDLDRLIGRVRRAFPKLTQFELLTAVAFLWFAEKKVDVAVMEVGLGGRLDATNVLRRVLVSVITNIGLDHTEWLGKTIPKIAFEKAGIIKPGVPVVTGATGSARRVIQSVAALRRAPMTVVSKPGRFTLRLVGAHQQRNAAVAYAALEQLHETRFETTASQRRASFKRAQWPGRFEQIGRVVLDGAHNVDGCRALAAALKNTGRAPVSLLFGVLKEKDVAGMIRALAPVVKHCAVVPIRSERTTDPMEVASRREWKGKAVALPTIESGFEWIAQQSKKGPAVVAGSLYLVGAARARLIKEKS